ncbi:MAG: hypothetical protein FWD73_12810 [Polyangiaceae bacterium]|nr:hypothetical protein [Polyangiaceae bacterium]
MPVLREGDISTLGVCFETDAHVGSAGDIHLLTILSADQVHSLRIVGQITRKHLVDGVDGASRASITFTFVPDGARAADTLRHFVCRVFAVRYDRSSGVRPCLPPSLVAAAQNEAQQELIDRFDHAGSIYEAEREARSEGF